MEDSDSALTGEPGTSFLGERRIAPTVSDVAAAAGVSHATAARALGGYGSVSRASRTRVEAAASRLGYRRNSIASSMVTGRTQTIGFVGADIGNPFFARALRGTTDAAHRAGFEVVVANTDEDPELEASALRVMNEKRVDGVILAPSDLDLSHEVTSFLEAGTPVVCLDRVIRGAAVDAVLVDNVRSAYVGVEHLIQLGHRRIGLVTSPIAESEDKIALITRAALDPLHAIPGIARSVGYLAAHEAADLRLDADLISTSHFDADAAAVATTRLLELPEPPTAIFAVDNVRALGAYRAILASGLDFPGQISLLGFDDLEWTTIVRPSLSVVAQPAYELGARAARRLLARLDGDTSPPQIITLETRLIPRDSTRERSDGGSSAPARTS